MRDLRFSLKRIAEFVRAREMGAGVLTDSRRLVAGVSTDSRTIRAGELFVALKGEHFDGHDHAARALEKGALAVLLERRLGLAADDRAILVEDSLRALGQLAGGLRRSREHLKVAAVTGSSGKTGVKEMLASILGLMGPTLATAGNFNNLIGLPLTLFRVTRSTRLAVLEMGMNHFGEIARLTEIARPDVGVISSVGPAHLEFFGRISEVARAKGELFAGLGPEAVAVVKADDPLIMREAGRFSGNKLYFGCDSKAQVTFRKWRGRGFKGQIFELRGPGLAGGLMVRLPLLGAHNAENALAAASAALALGASWEQIAAGLEQVRPPAGRLALVEARTGWKILDDSYNANPASMEAGLRTLAGLPGREPKGAVLGDMLELGSKEAAGHRRTAALAGELKLEYLALVGPRFARAAGGAVRAGLRKDRVRTFETAAAAAAWAATWPPRTRILVKASHALGLEAVVKYLKEA